MDKCGICSKPAVQLFETGDEGVYACFKCQPLVPEVTIGDNGTEHSEQSEHSEQQDVSMDGDEVVIEQDGTDSQLYCGICHKSFEKNMQLQNHLRNHRAERRFVCMYCNKAFSQSNNLRAHLRIHTNERPYKCSECGKAFTQVTNLNNHVRLHTGERPFVCPEPGCNKAYAQVTNLNQHRKRHLNGRPVETTYDCTICGEQFQQRNHMYNHRRDVHAEVSKSAARNPPRRAHACELCDAVLPSERALHRHVADHVGRHVGHQHAAQDKGTLACVFSACGLRFESAHEHTEHLLRAHQLRVLTATTPKPPRRGRPPKPKDDPPPESKESEPGFHEIKIVNTNGQLQFLPKLKVQSLFQ